MPNITKIKVNGTSYDVEDAAATQGIAGLDTALVNFQNSAGAANGLATLDSTVKVPSAQMPMAAINNYIASNTRDSVLVTTNSPSISVTSYDNIGLRVGLGLSITFLVDVTGSAGTDTMTISYNGGNAIPIKVAKDGTIVNFAPNQISNTWKFVQTGVTLEVRYIENGGDTYWLIVGNPVVLSSSTDGYTIYADGYSKYSSLYLYPTVDELQPDGYRLFVYNCEILSKISTHIGLFILGVTSTDEYISGVSYSPESGAYNNYNFKIVNGMATTVFLGNGYNLWVYILNSIKPNASYAFLML